MVAVNGGTGSAMRTAARAAMRPRSNRANPRDSTNVTQTNGMAITNVINRPNDVVTKAMMRVNVTAATTIAVTLKHIASHSRSGCRHGRSGLREEPFIC